MEGSPAGPWVTEWTVIPSGLFSKTFPPNILRLTTRFVSMATQRSPIRVELVFTGEAMALRNATFTLNPVKFPSTTIVG